MKFSVNNMKIKKRLNTDFAIVISIFNFVGLIIVASLIFMVKDYNKVLNNYAFPQGDIGKLMYYAAETRSATRAIIGYESQELIAEAKRQRDSNTAYFVEILEKVRPTMVTPEGDACILAIDAAWEAYHSLENEIVEMGSSTDKAMIAAAQQRMLDELAPVYNELDDALKELMEVNIEKGSTQQKLLQTIEVVLIILIALTITIAVYISIRIVNSVSKGIADPLVALDNRLESFAKGDFSSPFPTFDSKDEIGDIVLEAKEMAHRLNTVLGDTTYMLQQMAKGNYDVESKCEEQYEGDLRELLNAIQGMNSQMNLALEQVDIAAVQVFEGATHLSDVAELLAEGASEQAFTVQQMQTTVNSLNEVIHDTSNKLEDSYQQAQKYAKAAENSRTDMTNLMGAMARISEASEKIGNIITEIEDIASQTNLLSLNASIEAARAGDAGRGFAVVPDQIRTLAEQSAKSAVDSRKLIEASLMEVSNGNTVATNASESLQEVVAGVHSLAESAKIMKEISAGQANSMEQADMGINRIAEVVESNSATAQEASATSQELTNQANIMTELVGRFTLKK